MNLESAILTLIAQQVAQIATLTSEVETLKKQNAQMQALLQTTARDQDDGNSG